MEITKQLLALLRCYLTAEVVPEEDYPEQNDVGSLFSLAKKHDVAHLIGIALEKAPKNLQERYKAFYQEEIRAMHRYLHLERAKKEICDFLEKCKIPYIPLKGAVIRSLYPEPWHRTSCDIDILVPEHEHSAAVKCFQKELGYRKGHTDKHDVSLWSPKGVHLELHFDIDKDYLKVQEFWQSAKPVAEGSFCQEVSGEMLLFNHFAHMARHYCLGGCGIRPFLDLWLMQRKVSYDADALKAMLESRGLMAFADSVFSLLEVWFGEKAPTDSEKLMTQFLINGGVYGSLDNKVSVARVGKQKGLSYIWSRIFPSLSALQNIYPGLRKYPVLVPFYWLHRCFRLLFTGGIQKAGREFKISSQTKQADILEMEKLLKELGLAK